VEETLGYVSEFTNVLEVLITNLNSKKTANLLRGKDLNLRPLGYEHNLIMSGPFVS
jgi:hypothetical protein